MTEAFGRFLKKANQIGIIKKIKPSQNSPPMTHHQFVDNTILIGKASIKEARVMKSILDKYEATFDKKVNYEKTLIGPI